jgi:Fe2+ or Zn2+ uptake regulation protein
VTGLTEQRRLITEIIQKTDGHMTAEQIYNLAKAQMPCIAIGTVYRNLGLMERDGEIVRIAIPNAPDRYDRNVQFHEHMLCRKCGVLEDIWLGNLLEVINAMTQTKIESYELAMFGVCQSCQESAAAAEETQFNLR